MYNPIANDLKNLNYPYIKQSNSENVNTSVSSVDAKQSALKLEKVANAETAIPNQVENLEKIQKLIIDKELLLQQQSEVAEASLQQEIRELKKHYSPQISSLASIVVCLMRQIADQDAQHEVALNSKSIEIERLRSMLSTQLALLEEQEQKNAELEAKVQELELEKTLLTLQLDAANQHIEDEDRATRGLYTNRDSDDSENDEDAKYNPLADDSDYESA